MRSFLVSSAWLAFLASSLASVAIACGDSSASSSSTSPVEPASSSGASSDGNHPDEVAAEGVADATPAANAVDGGAEATASPSCPNLDAKQAKVVVVETIAGPLPTFAGGAIVPGRYEMTSARDYIVLGTPTAAKPTYRGVVEVTPTEITMALDPDGDTRSTTLTYGTSSNTLELDVRCIVQLDGGVRWPDFDGETLYEATPTTLTLRGNRRQKLAAQPDGGYAVIAEAIEVYTFTR
jgi:hypothetical protein